MFRSRRKVLVFFLNNTKHYKITQQALSSKANTRVRSEYLTRITYSYFIKQIRNGFLCRIIEIPNSFSCLETLIQIREMLRDLRKT